MSKATQRRREPGERSLLSQLKARRLAAFARECKRAGLPIPAKTARTIRIRTDAGTLVGWVDFKDHNFSRKYGRFWDRGREIEAREKRTARNARKAEAL